MLPGQPARAVPAWYPGWAREFAELYFAGTTCVFVMHGNVHDLVPCGEAAGDRLRQTCPSSWRRSSSARGTSCCGTT